MKTAPLVVRDKSLETVVENETQRILREALKRLGPNGENWHRGDYCNGPQDKFCAIGAVTVARHGLVRGTVRVGGFTVVKETENWLTYVGQPLARAARMLAKKEVHRLNDSAASFSEVRAMFELAIELSA